MSNIIHDLLRRCVDSNSIKKVGSKHGGEWHSPCPTCGGRDRFITFPLEQGKELVRKHNISGTWACPRHCGTGGDVIDFCTKHLGMTFTDACAELGITLEKQMPQARRKYSPLRELPAAKTQSWEPIAYVAPSAKWITQATKLAHEAHERLLATPHVLAYLQKRGLPIDAVKRYGLGYIESENAKSPTYIFRQRSAFDIPNRARTDGTVARALRIPRGITIPCFGNTQFEVWRVRIRRCDSDLDKSNPRDVKFQLIPQANNPYSAPMILYPQGVSPELATWVIVEAELDAMLVHHACGGRVGVLSILTVSGKPDSVAYEILKKSARILVSIDFEQNAQGEYHTAKNWNWWKAQFAQAKLWPVPRGKDPGEAFALGINVARWIFLAVPELIQEKKQDSDSVPSPLKSLEPLGALESEQSVVEKKEQQSNMPAFLSVEIIKSLKTKPWQWKKATASTPFFDVKLPTNVPALESLIQSFTDDCLDENLTIVCPRCDWEWVSYKGCIKCNGHSKCILAFQISLIERNEW